MAGDRGRALDGLVTVRLMLLAVTVAVLLGAAGGVGGSALVIGEGSRGPAGPPGEVGPAGPEGPEGPEGESGTDGESAEESVAVVDEDAVLDVLRGGSADDLIRDAAGVDDLCSQMQLSDLDAITDIALLGC